MIKANFSAYSKYVTDSLNQWDLNQVLQVTGINLVTAPEVHFSNANCDRAIVRQATMENHIISVTIPNSLLQDPLRIYAHIGVYEGETFKVVELVEIPVAARKRPLDYQIEDSDEEVYSFKRLENLIGNAATKDQVANIVAGVGSDAELVDVRYGADGKTYASAGEAVREQLDTKLDKNFANISTPVGVTYIHGGYKNVQGTTISIVENEKMNAIVVPVVSAGERYRLRTYMDISAVMYNFFAFETETEGVAAVSAANIKNYVEHASGTEYDYIFTIPDGCVKFYTAVGVGHENEVTIHKLDTFEAPTLRLIEKNFPENCIPASALTEIVTGMSSLEKPFDFTGKSLFVFGDSITVGVTSPNLAVTENSYIKLFADKFNMALTNLAESGSTLASSAESTLKCITDKVCSRTAGDPDFVFIAGGTNDYNQGRALGKFGDTEKTTVYGALHVICEHLKTYFADATVIFITPVNVTKKFAASVESLYAYRKAIFEVATSYGFNVVDGAAIGLPDKTGTWANTMTADTDGVHPTEAGHKLYFQGLCNQLC
jgi:lysophospholipase L1-like esterase